MNRSNPGLLVSFEGTEGSGKSTLIKGIHAHFKQRGYRVLATREPGGCPLGETLRTLVLSSSMHPKTELFLYEAARSEHFHQVILPALSTPTLVLCDRFTDSTLAYQSYARGLPWEEVNTLNNLASSVQPDLVVFLDIDPEKGLKRARNPNRFEAEGVEFQAQVRMGYLKARTENPERWFTLDDQHFRTLIPTLVQELWRRFGKALECMKI